MSSSANNYYNTIISSPSLAEHIHKTIISIYNNLYGMNNKDNQEYYELYWSATV